MVEMENKQESSEEDDNKVLEGAFSSSIFVSNIFYKHTAIPSFSNNEMVWLSLCEAF